MIPSKRSHLHVAAISHPGMKGKNNEDRYAVSAYFVDEEQRLPALLAVVCDGIGGHRAGEVAAEIAVQIISDTVAQSDASQPLATLQEAIAQASQAIRSQAELDPSRKGMGATCACAWIIGNRLYIASVGDSRIYLARKGAIHRLTTDHTWIQEALDQGILTPEQARGHPNAHVIRRYLGSQQPAEADIRLNLNGDPEKTQVASNQGLVLEADDILLLCSDGLTDLVEDAEIQDALQKQRLEEALKGLVNLANERGGHDNITLVALKSPTPKAVPGALPAPARKRQDALPVFLIALSGGVFILLLAALAIAGVYLLQPSATATLTFTPPASITAAPALQTPSGTPESPATQVSPPARLATRTARLPPTAGPTLTPWPTSTGVFLDFPTASPTP